MKISDHPARVTGSPIKKNMNNSLSVLYEKILAADRVALARAITLVESNRADHFEQAQQLLEKLMPRRVPSIRVGITGVPRAGKRTLIEALGLFLIEKGHKVAVLAIDPSSSRSGGSILGDKTRMEQLARHERAFIRPSPSSGALGGVARKTRESIVLCEAAGYDVVLVETMGVGQGEIAVRDMVDVFLLIQIAGAGDELQGIKRGIMEMADAIIVNKADGANRERARAAQGQLRMALHYLDSGMPEWKPPVLLASALEGRGMDEIWETVRRFLALVEKNGGLEQRRRRQDVAWMYAMVDDEIRRMIREHKAVSRALKESEHKVGEGSLSPAHAALLISDRIRKLLERE